MQQWPLQPTRADPPQLCASGLSPPPSPPLPPPLLPPVPPSSRTGAAVAPLTATSVAKTLRCRGAGITAAEPANHRWLGSGRGGGAGGWASWFAGQTGAASASVAVGMCSGKPPVVLAASLPSLPLPMLLLLPFSIAAATAGSVAAALAEVLRASCCCFWRRMIGRGRHVGRRGAWRYAARGAPATAADLRSTEEETAVEAE